MTKETQEGVEDTMQEQRGSRRGEQIVSGVRWLGPVAAGGVKILAPVVLGKLGTRYPTAMITTIDLGGV